MRPLHMRIVAAIALGLSLALASTFAYAAPSHGGQGGMGGGGYFHNGRGDGIGPRSGFTGHMGRTGGAGFDANRSGGSTFHDRGSSSNHGNWDHHEHGDHHHHSDVFFGFGFGFPFYGPYDYGYYGNPYYYGDPYDAYPYGYYGHPYDMPAPVKLTADTVAQWVEPNTLQVTWIGVTGGFSQLEIGFIDADGKTLKHRTGTLSAKADVPTRAVTVRVRTLDSSGRTITETLAPLPR